MDVSIIIPVYNASEFIEKCLLSVQRQQGSQNFECLLVDDCSTDESVSIIENFIQRNDGDISYKLFRQNVNKGPSAARNLGIRHATGEYVFFLDSDDSLTDNCISNLLALAKKYDADYVQGTYVSDKNYHMPSYAQSTNPNVGNIYTLQEFSEDRRYIKRIMLNYNIIPYTPHNRLVKRKMLLENQLLFNQKISVREDFYWMFFLAKVVERFAVCKTPTYYRGYNDSSLTHNINMEREIKGARTLIEDFSQNIDSFMVGCQKELLLETLLMTLDAKYYYDEEERKNLIMMVRKQNSFLENIFLNMYLHLRKGFLADKILHALVRIYKIDD